ncbi:FMN-binding negative transcriptional regulator [Actinomadura spongiicola]|uniref:FMN-binding negative transcriptional regulator n=1 Tax=Actinomadura spongiicola TaxID=2303421 RepID=A0A372GFN1_9ACTN|nr:FMN-binding negative transcriptional regulator [Actinomadura spongiicola]RFS84168.1 FMN-binding negative transcriptional regulator [Actinomadura spongiicola]
MFVPHAYREPDESWMHDLVHGNPLAQLVSNGKGPEPPWMTHVPIIVDPHASRPPGDLSGLTLWGHMNRENPHWSALGTAAPVVVAFTGPHAYVSPAVYGSTPTAPTWDFTAVHAHGTLHKVDSADETLATVLETVRTFESRFGAGWSMTDSLGYFRRILPGVGAFRVAVTRADGMFKLSQEQSPQIRGRVRDAFAQRACTHHRAIASLMDRLEPKAGDLAEACSSPAPPSLPRTD